MEESQNFIDWSYRPSGYFWAKDRGIFLASDIKGAQRRKFYERLLQSGDQQAIDEFVLKSTLTERERRAAGSLHPAFMGGEYLPVRAAGTRTIRVEDEHAGPSHR